MNADVMPDERRTLADWVRENATLPMVLSLFALFASGVTYINQVQSLEVRVKALEQAVLPAALAAARQDEALKAIQQQLAEIKDDVKDIKRRQ
ncbi:hypothetical protein [Luteitalea sp.]|uniref:hypothetical protein n=1 Tax=Luteitalea sp. TaxID=2004800 RepID=UPI0025BDBEFA|nr:hypothetical protein [Luteitalea sp.]